MLFQCHRWWGKYYLVLVFHTFNLWTIIFLLYSSKCFDNLFLETLVRKDNSLYCVSLDWLERGECLQVQDHCIFSGFVVLFSVFLYWRYVWFILGILSELVLDIWFPDCPCYIDNCCLWSWKVSWNVRILIYWFSWNLIRRQYPYFLELRFWLKVWFKAPFITKTCDDEEGYFEAEWFRISVLLYVRSHWSLFNQVCEFYFL